MAAYTGRQGSGRAAGTPKRSTPQGLTGRKKKNTKSRSRLSGLLILFCAFLICAAVLTAYFLTSYVIEKNMSSDTGTASQTEGRTASFSDGNPSGTAADSSVSAPLSITLPELIFVLNSETGETKQLFLSVLDCASCRLTLLRIDPRISYTMSGGLFASLTPGNAELSQTVTFSELYRYYHSDTAFEAGLKIISEMLNVSISSSVVIPDYAFEEFIVTDPVSGECRLCVEKDFALSAYGTPGSTRGAIEAGLKASSSTLDLPGRMRYLEVYDALDGIVFLNLPVKESNERTVLDDSAAQSMLYSVLYPTD